MKDIDVWRACQLLINQHGDEAFRIALDRGDALLNKGDVEGGKAWGRIAEAIAIFLNKKPLANEHLN